MTCIQVQIVFYPSELRDYSSQSSVVGPHISTNCGEYKHSEKEELKMKNVWPASTTRLQVVPP